ncbi:MAG: transglycosylase domain-containing protein [Polyangiales bacterium]
MLRFLTERRAWVVAASIVLMLAGIGLWLGARALPSRAGRLLGTRLGLDVDIQRAELGLRGITLREIRIHDESGGVEVRVERVRADVTPWGALVSGASAVTAVDAKGMEVSIDLARPGIDQELARLRQALAPRGLDAKPIERSASGGRGRDYAITDLVVDIIDAEGPLVRMSGVDLRKEGNVITAAADSSLIGDEEFDHVRIGQSSTAIERMNGVWSLRALSIDGGNVRSTRNDDDPRLPLVTRVRNAARLMRAPAGPSEPGPTQSSPSDERHVFLSRLTRDAKLSLEGLDIESRAEVGNTQRIENLGFTLQGLGDGWFLLRGGGRTSNGGTVETDLKLQPVEARAEGEITVRGVSLALVAPFVPEVPLHQPEESTVSAELAVEADASGQMRLDGTMSLRNGALSSERLAPAPIENLNLEVDGEGVWFPLERRLLIEQARIRSGKATVLIEGELERTREHYRADLTVRMPPTPCNDVVGAIPSDVLGVLRGFQWSGTWGGIGHLAVDSRDLQATELKIRVRNLCEFQRLPRAARVDRFQQPFRHSVIEPDETGFEMVTGPGTPNWVPLTEVSPYLVEAVLSHEDARFYEHGGFAPWAIRDALVRNLEEGRYVVGASTISMQLAKNLYLKREKTIARKVQEVILTWWLENALNKDQILELYLNVIEYGPGLYGLRNASMHYFGRTPVDLSPAEAVFLACILPAPKRFHTSYERDALTRSMRGKTTRLLEHMAKRGRISPDALEYGLAEIAQFAFHQEDESLPPARILPPMPAPVEPSEAPDPFEALFVAP